MSVHQIYTDSPLANYNYFIDLNENDVIVIDPLFPDQIIEWAKENSKTIAVIVITHDHPDHIQGMPELKKRLECKVWGHSSLKESLELVDRYLEDGETISSLNGEIEILHTPGHHPTHICLLGRNEQGEQEWLVTMDTIFNAGVGHCRLGGTVEILYETVKKIGNYIDDKTVIYAGHDYIENNLNFTIDREPDNIEAVELLRLVKQVGGRSIETDLGKEKEINTFFRLSSKSIRENLGCDVETDLDVFVELRRLRDNW